MNRKTSTHRAERITKAVFYVSVLIVSFHQCSTVLSVGNGVLPRGIALSLFSTSKAYMKAYMNMYMGMVDS